MNGSYGDMKEISEIDKVILEISKKYGGQTIISEKLRVDKNGFIQGDKGHIIEISHVPSGICFEIDEHSDLEKNKLVGVKLLQEKLSKNSKSLNW